MTFSLEDKLDLYLRSSIGKCEKINLDCVYEDEKENKVSIFSGSFRYLVPKVVNAILKDNMQELENATKPTDQLYTIQILEAIKKSANIGQSVSISVEKNNYS